jgi:hypothetical protein
MTETCPQYKANHQCYYEENFEALTSRDGEGYIAMLEVFADIDTKRALRAHMVEQRMSGQTANDPAVTRLLEKAVQSRIRLEEIKRPVKQEAERSVSLVMKETGAATSSPGGGLISALMSTLAPRSPSPPSSSEPLTIDTVGELTED